MGKLYILIFGCILLFLSSCSSFNKIMKTPDTDFKYEAAKQFFFMNKNSNAAFLLDQIMPGLKGTEKGDEATFLVGMTQYQSKDYSLANDYLKKYLTNYPAGYFTDVARFYSAKALYMSTPQMELDQTGTYQAITELQNYIEYDPTAHFASTARDMIYELQDKLVAKEYNAAKLYYNLGGYIGNSTMGGNNYEACIVTAENAIKDYPYSALKEDFSILILKSKYHLALQSVKEKMKERLENTIDEYYGFLNGYPTSKYMDEAKRIFEKAQDKYKSL